MNRKEILENRKKWITFLKTNPPKIKGMLESFKNQSERCCLGHGCYVFNLQKEVDNQVIYEGSIYCAPPKLIELLGLRDDMGNIPQGYFDGDNVYTELTEMNDETNMTHKEIGEYLESVIEGGDNSPFLPLGDFDE